MTHRTLVTTAGTRTTLKFNATEWRAVERAAASARLGWADWARDVLDLNKGTINAHATLRTAALDAVLNDPLGALLEARSNEEPPPALLACASTMDDLQLEEDQAAAQLDGAAVDLTAFTVQAGTDQFGRACLWIRNGLREGLHYAIPLQTTTAEQSRRLAGADWRTAEEGRAA